MQRGSRLRGDSRDSGWRAIARVSGGGIRVIGACGASLAAIAAASLGENDGGGRQAWDCLPLPGDGRRRADRAARLQNLQNARAAERAGHLGE